MSKLFQRALMDFIFPPSPWRGCHVLQNYERLAQWEVRLGQHKEKKRMQLMRVRQKQDMRLVRRLEAQST